jgi:hypothetical protein
MKPADAFSPKALIVHYCFAMVLAGCIGVSMNSKLFDEQKTASAIEVTAEASAGGSTSLAQEIELWTGCPTHDGVRDSIDALANLISEAENIVATLHENHDRWNENNKRTNIEGWREQARAWEMKNESIISACPQLLGATGFSVFPEIPMALENLKSSQHWLNYAIKSASSNDFKSADEFIAAANKASERATKLIDLKVKPKRKNALVILPKHLQRRAAQIASAE